MGLGGAAVAGGALALGGGGDGSGGPPGGGATTSPFGSILQANFSGLQPGTNQFFDVNARAAGNLTVTVNWGDPARDIDVYLATPACTNSNAYPPEVCALLARAETHNKPETLQASVTAGAYRIVVAWCGDPACGEGGPESGSVQATLAAP